VASLQPRNPRFPIDTQGLGGSSGFGLGRQACSLVGRTADTMGWDRLHRAPARCDKKCAGSLAFRSNASYKALHV